MEKEHLKREYENLSVRQEDVKAGMNHKSVFRVVGLSMDGMAS